MRECVQEDGMPVIFPCLTLEWSDLFAEGLRGPFVEECDQLVGEGIAAGNAVYRFLTRDCKFQG